MSRRNPDSPATPSSSSTEGQRNLATIQPVTLRHLLAEVARGGHDANALCEGLGFTPSDLASSDFLLSIPQCTRVIRRALRLLRRPALGLELGASVNMVSWGLLSLGFMASATSRQLLEFAIAHHHDGGRLILLGGEERDQSFCLVAKAHFHDRDVASFIVDKTFAAMVQICRQVVGNLFNPRQVELVMERPPYGVAYENVFRCPVRFGCAENRVYFPLEPYVIRTADAVVLKQAARWLAPAGPESTPASDLEASVIQSIRRDLAHPPPLGAIAASLHTSERTLRRRLTERGQSYADLLSEERKSRALSLITHSSRSVQQIAVECGFADARTLQRAIKRWTGYSPTAFRKQTRQD